MKQAYAGVYRDLHERHWWWRSREAVLLRELAARAPGGGWRRILDVGCGDALFFDQLKRFGDVWGVEPDASLIRDDNPYRARIHVGSFDESSRAEAPFGRVLMLDVLEHMRDPVRALRRVREVLEPDGALLVTVPAFPVLWTRHDDWNDHVVRHTRRSLGRAAGEAGLTVVASRYLYHWLFPAKLAVRAVEAMRRGRAGPASIPPTWINRTLIRVSEAEERLLGWARLPFGSSLLAWCVPAAAEAGTAPVRRQGAASGAG